MTTDYSWITSDMLASKLTEIVDRSSTATLLQVPGVYEALSEHFNNEVLDELARERNSGPVTR